MRTQDQEDEYLSLLKDILKSFNDQKFIALTFQKYISDLTNNRIGQSLFLPDNKILLTEPNNFGFISLPKDFVEFQMQYYQEKCYYCTRNLRDSVTCLICGVTLCYLQECTHQAQDREEKGPLSYHARAHEGNSCIFIQTSTGQLIAV